MTEENELPYSPASERNREPIARVLEYWLPERARVLEIGSGSGQHAAYFHERMPALHWQTTELPENLPGLKARLERDAPDLPAPLALDVTAADWPRGPFDALFTANTLHIMPWDHTPALFERAAGCLRSGGLIIIYGPFRSAGRHTAESNRRFDQSLRERDPAMGVRDAAEIARIARANGLTPEADIDMPANNRILVYRNES